MRFLVDMGLSTRVADWLREQGHDAVHAREIGLYRAMDQQIVDRAARDGRVVVTADLDFGELMALSGSSAVSVVLFRVSSFRFANLVARLGSALQGCSEALTSGAIVVVENDRLRIRRLPIERSR